MRNKTQQQKTNLLLPKLYSKTAFKYANKIPCTSKHSAKCFLIKANITISRRKNFIRKFYIYNKNSHIPLAKVDIF